MAAMRDLKIVLQCLRNVLQAYLEDSEDFDPECGICSHLQMQLILNHHSDIDCGVILPNLFQTWDKFSGDINYPVPSSTEDVPADDAYNHTRLMWYGEYGRMRVQLLNHCIRELEKLCA